MKKTLLAAALIAGFAGVAQAETSVTLYGIIDTGIGYNNLKGSATSAAPGVAVGDGVKYTRTGLVNGVESGSRWGLKGAEDLGGGLQAVFQLESGFDSSVGTSAQGGRLFGRQATIGLQGDSWGRFDLGRQTNIASKYSEISPFGVGWFQAGSGAAFTSTNTVRLDNMAMYQTPNFSGFQFGVGYSFNADGAQSFKNSDASDTNKRAVTTGLRYKNGPISAALTYDQFKAKGTGLTAGAGGSDEVTVHEWNIGGNYDFEIVKLYLGFGQTRNGLFVANGFGGTGVGNEIVASPSAFKGIDGLRVNSYTVGLSAPLGAGNLMASWAMADPRNAGSTEGTAFEMGSKQHIYSLGYTYNLSKRTDIYAVGSYARHVNFQDDLKSTMAAVGIRHQF